MKMRLLLFGVVLLGQYFSLVSCFRGCNSLLANYQNKDRSISPLYVALRGFTADATLATIRNGLVEMNHDQSVLIGCPRTKTGQQNSLKVRARSTTAIARPQTLFVNHVIAKCNNGRMEFSNVGPALELIEPSTMACRGSYDSIVEYQGTNPKKFSMYFKVPTQNKLYSVKIMDGLLDYPSHNALLTHITMQPEAINSGGRSDDKFSVPVNCPSSYRLADVTQNYSPNNHINQLLSANPPSGLKECLQHPQIKKGDNAMRISRGHLTANADFVTAPERAATFCYLNAAPQWQITNGGNFAKVEAYARRTAHQLGRPLEVYTGTHGKARVVLDGNRVIEARSHTLRIPEVFWKILYDPTARSALVFIVFNSPCPWNTLLLNALTKSNSKCSKQHCDTVGLNLARGTANAPFDVNGLTFCCSTVNDAIAIFKQDAAFNELELLPWDVKNAKTLPRNIRPPGKQ